MKGECERLGKGEEGKGRKRSEVWFQRGRQNRWEERKREVKDWLVIGNKGKGFRV